MISAFIYDSKKEEMLYLKKLLKEMAAILTVDKWSVQYFDNIKEFRNYIEEEPLIDFGCFDITSQDSFQSILDFRKKYKDAMLVLIADVNTLPTTYLKPGIRADSLLLRPFNDTLTRETLNEFLKSYLYKVEETNEESLFYIEDKEGKICIPYNSIFYFEAKEKKVYVRTLNEEFGFYSTLEQLEKSLPVEFMRCHRSFIVNSDKLKNVHLSQSVIHLTEGFIIPLSRSYKSLFKEYR